MIIEAIAGEAIAIAGYRTPYGIVSADAVNEMRDWIFDCVWGDIENEDSCILTDAAIITGVHRHYDGGIEAFLLSL